MAKSSKKKAGEVPDLEELVLSWAKEMFKMTRTKEQAKLDKDCLQYNVNWQNVKFTFGDPDYSMIVPHLNAAANTSTPTAPKKNVQPQTLFRTVFANNTQQEQEYSFKTERCTRSVCTVIVEEGYSRGFNFSLGLKAPEEVVEANAGFSREISVTNIGEDTIEEELTWGVDSLVKVPPQTETTAELVVSETQCEGDFVMESTIKGRVVVTVTNLRENNALVTVVEGDMCDIIANAMRAAGGLKGFRVQGRTVTAQTRGSCTFKFGVEQRMNITERKLLRPEY